MNDIGTNSMHVFINVVGVAFSHSPLNGGAHIHNILSRSCSLFFFDHAMELA